MNLTREQAIAEHRKMWNWIAEQIEDKQSVIDIEICKGEYCAEHGFTINCNCFLCEYTEENNIACSECILKWGDNAEDECGMTHDEKPGIYRKAIYSEYWQEQASLARKIANLPERTDM